MVTDIGNNVAMRLYDLISNLLNSSQDILFKMSDEADNNDDRSRYFELMNQIRMFKATIANDFNNNIKEFLLPAGEYEARQLDKQLSDDELSLVDENDMEGMILVKCIGERATTKYHEQLSYLEARLDYLQLKTDKIFKTDALTPTNFCQAFDDALSGNFDIGNKKLLFGMFDEEVANKLDALYESVNNRLIDADILPQIRHHFHLPKSQRTRPKPSPAANDHITEELDEYGHVEDNPHYNGDYAASGSTQWSGSGTGGQLTGAHTGGGGAGATTVQARARSINGFAMTAAPGGNYRQACLSRGENTEGDYTVHRGGATGNTGDMAGGAAHVSAGSNTPASGDNKQYQHYTAGLPASQVSQVLSNFIGASFAPDSLAKPAANNSEFYPQSTAQYFGHDEVIQALSSIQNQPQFTEQDSPYIDGEKIKHALLETIAKTSGGVVTKSINQLADKTIDFIELVFDAINEDEEISDTIKALLMRLQIPIIKASMSDQAFFIYDSHPARQLLDKITRVGVGVTQHNDEVYIFLDKVVNDVLGDYDLSSHTFERALDDLELFIVQQEDITSVREAEQQKELLRKHARRIILKSIRAITIGKELPEAIHPIILKRWPTLMFRHYLANGKENKKWQNLLLILRQIVDSAQTITSAEYLAKLNSTKDSLFEQIEKYLNISRKSKDDVKNIMAVYTAMVQQHIDDASFTAEEISDAEKNISDAAAIDEIPVEQGFDMPVIPPKIMPGMWFQLYMGENITSVRCKLSVILVEDANLMFVNHMGELVMEKSFDEFNDEIAKNRTKIIMGHSAFESAFNAVINGLH